MNGALDEPLKGGKESTSLYFCLICKTPPLSSHSGSHNLPPPSNLPLRPTNKVSNATFYAPRVRTYSELQHICLLHNISFVNQAAKG